MSSTKSGKSACRRVFRSQAKLYWRRERRVGGVRGSAAGAGFSAAAGRHRRTGQRRRPGEGSPVVVSGGGAGRPSRRLGATRRGLNFVAIYLVCVICFMFRKCCWNIFF